MREGINRLIMTLIGKFLNETPDAIRKEDVDMIASGCGISRREAYEMLFAGAIGLDIADNPLHAEIFRKDFPRMLEKKELSRYTQDAYFQNIGRLNAVSGEFRLGEFAIQPYEAFVAGDIKEYEDGACLAQIGWMEEAFASPALFENERIWMTLAPNEIETIYPASQRAFGSVLSMGLGLGYFQFHALMNPKVTHVTVVERSEKVIELFKTHIQPRFPKEKKLTILCADAFEAAERLYASGKYDFVFADLWHDAGDGAEMYRKLKAMEKGNLAYEYWIEETLKYYV